jgi:hypothetical protein
VLNYDGKKMIEFNHTYDVWSFGIILYEMILRLDGGVFLDSLVYEEKGIYT